MSEVIGVVILLAGVVSILSGVVVLMQPFLEDISDNKDWARARIAADQLNERLVVAAQQPEGTGMVVTAHLGAASLGAANGAEVWIVSADLLGDDRVSITLTSLASFEITSVNETYSNLSIRIGDVVTDWTPAGPAPQTWSGNISFSTGSVIVDVYNSDGDIIHRMVRVGLGGLQMKAGISSGFYEVDLVNGARMDKLPNGNWEVGVYPRLRLDTSLDGTPRVTLLLLDIDTIGRLPQAGDGAIEIETVEQSTLFDAVGRNLRFEVENNVDPTITPRYLDQWSGEYDLYVASGLVDEYRGFGPYQSLSGSDGLGLWPSGESFDLRVQLQRLEVRG